MSSIMTNRQLAALLEVLEILHETATPEQYRRALNTMRQTLTPTEHRATEESKATDANPEQ